jgi:hypothetical protein
MRDNFQAYYSYQISEGDKIIKKGRKKSHSFVEGMAHAFSHFLALTYNFSSTDTGGTVRSYSGYGGYGAGITDGTYGILIGTGSNSESISDYKLQSQTGHGTTSNFVYYNACTIGAAAATPSDISVRVARTFTNQSGVTKTIEEIGLASRHSTGYKFLHIRDLTGGITVNNGQTLTINYDFITML